VALQEVANLHLDWAGAAAGTHKDKANREANSRIIIFSSFIGDPAFLEKGLDSRSETLRE
jgi:hypothetical protein